MGGSGSAAGPVGAPADQLPRSPGTARHAAAAAASAPGAACQQQRCSAQGTQGGPSPSSPALPEACSLHCKFQQVALPPAPVRLLLQCCQRRGHGGAVAARPHPLDTAKGRGLGVGGRTCVWRLKCRGCAGGNCRAHTPCLRLSTAAAPSGGAGMECPVKERCSRRPARHSRQQPA